MTKFLEGQLNPSGLVGRQGDPEGVVLSQLHLGSADAELFHVWVALHPFVNDQILTLNEDNVPLILASRHGVLPAQPRVLLGGGQAEGVGSWVGRNG